MTSPNRPEIVQSSTEIVLDVVVRRDCSLCADMLFTLAELQADYHYQLRQLDVDADPVLLQRYDILVPVLLLDGAEVCHYFLDLVALREALAKHRVVLAPRSDA